MSHWRRRYHWLDEVGDFLLSEWIRDLIADNSLTVDQIKQAVYIHYNAVKNKRIQLRLDGVLAEIQKQDRVRKVHSGADTPDTTDTTAESKNKEEENNEEANKEKQELKEDEYETIKAEEYDELTPATYLKKQDELLSSKEYQEIIKLFENKMGILLQNYKTNKELEKECKQEDCKTINANEILEQCKCVQRIDVVLSIYHKLMKTDKYHKLWRKVPMGPIMSYNLEDKNKEINIKYGHVQIFNDFLHIKLCHVDVNDDKKSAETLCKYFEKTYPCKNISQCYAFSRHYRDRGNLEKEKKMFHFIQAYGDNQSQKILQMKQDIELIFQEECDKIHCNFLHSVYQFPNNPKDEKEEKKSNDRIDEMNKYGQGRSWEQKEQKEEQKKDESQSNNKEKRNTKKGYVGKKEDEQWLQQFKMVKNDEDGYKLLVKHMGIFRWQSAHGFRTGQYRGLSHLKPTFKNIKEEALYNSYSKASKDNWNQTLRKSKIFYQSFARNRIKTLYPGSFDDDISDTHITWKVGKEIELQEIVMLKLYTDFDKLQHELKKCFRWESIRPIYDKIDIDQLQNEDEMEEYDEKDTEGDIVNINDDDDKRKDLKNRLCEFFYWRVGLLVILYKYGKKINEQDKPLYHGVNAKMILNPAETMAFYGPLSTTSSYHVAKTFATAKGMVLKITSQYPRIDYCRAFDASVISDYPEEEEHLIGFIYMRVLEIRTRPIVNDIKKKALWDDAPLASKIRVVFFAIHLFRQQMFSMSEHLEYYLVEFLKCIRKDCCKQYTKQNATKEIMESFLSFLCCEVAGHKNALTTPKDWKDEKEFTETRVMKILWEKFNLFREKPNTKQVIKIDQISKGLKEFFLEKQEQKDVHQSDVYGVSFQQLLCIFPNLEEIHYINDYRFDNSALQKLLQVLQNKGRKTSLKTVRFVYYDYKDVKNAKGVLLAYPEEGNRFFHPDGLDKTLIQQLEKVGWIMKFNKNGRIGFKIRLYKEEPSDKLKQ